MQGRQDHFVSIVLPEIEDIVASNGKEAGNQALLEKLGEDYDESVGEGEVEKRNWFGRCVFKSDNDVCDNQTVTMTWDNDPLPSSPSFTPLQALRRRGAKTATLHMVAFTHKICQRFMHIYGEYGEVFADGDMIEVKDFGAGEKKVHWPYVPEGGGYGDGDEGLARQLVLAVERAKNLFFAAEEARREKIVVDFESWWEREVEGRLKT